MESWKWYCARTGKEEIAETRFRAVKAGARRSGLAAEQEEEDITELQAEGPLEHMDEDPGPSSRRAISVSSSSSFQAKVEPIEELPPGEDLEGDFAFVREFFGSGAGDTGTEEEVWQYMTSQVSPFAYAIVWELSLIVAEMYDGFNMERLLR